MKHYSPKIFAGASYGRSSEMEPDTDGKQELRLLENQEDPRLVSIDSEVFFIPTDGSRTMLYVPEHYSAFLVNRDVQGIFDLLKTGETFALNRETLAVLNYFILHRILSVDGAKKGFKSSHEQNDGNFEFKPTRIILHPTTECNLRCIYCYARGGDRKKKTMDFEIAKAAIDLLIRNALETGKDNVEVEFHGGGEPTLGMEFIKRSVSYTKSKCVENHLKCSFEIQSNMNFHKKYRQFVLDTFKWATASIDGTKDIQDLQRPRKDGSGSFDTAFENLKWLDEKGWHYGIHATVTNNSVEKLEEVTKFFLKNLNNIALLSYQPMARDGRACDDNMEEVGWDTYATNMRKAMKVARKHGIGIDAACTPLSNVKGTTSCGALGYNMLVTVDGLVATCLEVVDDVDERSDIFIIGKYDRESREFIFDKEKIKRLRRRNVNEMEVCRKCFAKYDCQGYCPMRIYERCGSIEPKEGLEWCRFFKDKFKEDMLDLLSNPKLQLSEDDYIELAEPQKIDESDIIPQELVTEWEYR